MVQNEPDAWPKKIELHGFTYNSLGGLGSSAGIPRRGSRWFVEWLAKHKPYTPQPYQDCAKVLREMGHPEMANDVLYAGREREREQALLSGQIGRATGLTCSSGRSGTAMGIGIFEACGGWPASSSSVR